MSPVINASVRVSFTFVFISFVILFNKL